MPSQPSRSGIECAEYTNERNRRFNLEFGQKAPTHVSLHECWGGGGVGREGHHMSLAPAYRQLLGFDWGTHSDFNKFAKRTFSWAAYEALLFLI